jgi:hypothetical protein
MPVDQDDPNHQLPPARARKRAAPAAPYEVGRGRPPKHSQFKPGNNANPRGRPKGARNIATILKDELDQRMPATIGGRTTKLQKRELLIKQLVQAGLKGDFKSLVMLIRLEQQFGGGERGAEAPAAAPLTARQMEIIDEFLGLNDEGASS